MQRLDKFMNDALSAYYHNRDPFGVDGDFITAPEISQLFGEIIGIWAVQKWMGMGMPPKINIIEIGAGRGTLMADLLRGTGHIKEFCDAVIVHIVETSDTLIKKQQSVLKKHAVSWHKHLLDISDTLPSIIIANEFFDALPVRQFKFEDGGWRELYVDGIDLVWQKIDNPPLRPILPPPKNGNVFEYSNAQESYALLMSHFNGAKLIIDYGYSKSTYGDSLQALYKHAPCAITDNVGKADLTTHIDFQWLSGFFKNSRVITQQQFLKENGIDIRYQKLNDPKLESGYQRLIDPDQMGDLFKVLECD